MRRIVQRWLVPVLLLVAAACASGGAQPESAGPRSRRDVLTKEQIEQTNETNVYGVVETLRGIWLRERGNDTLMGQPTRVQVYLDDVRMGTVENLRSINTSTVEYIQYFDGNAATARWGLGHGQGVIYVSTRRAPQ